MKTTLASITAAATVLTMFAVAQPQHSIAVEHGKRVFDRREPALTAAARRTELPATADRSLLVYAVAGFTAQFGALDLSTGKFLPIGPGLPSDVGAGLVAGPRTSLLTLGFSGNLHAIDAFTGVTSVVDATGLHDCSMPGSYHPNCANVIGRLDGSFYATDYANNLYSVDPVTAAAKLIGPTGMPAITFVPFSENPDGSVNVFGESLFSAQGKLYACFSTVALNFETGTFRALIPGAIYQINPATGHATWVAPTNPNLTTIVNVNNTLYAFDAWAGQVVTLDLTNGQTTRISDIDPDAGPLIAGATPARPNPAAAGH